MRILLLGKNGQLGWELCRTLAPLGEVVALDYPEIDLTKGDTIPRFIQEIKPQLIVNATAYTDVDRAEREPEIAYSVNTTAVNWLAKMAAKHKAAFIHYSTDYVFNGNKGQVYTEQDQPDPLNIYGKSKFGGEVTIQQNEGAYLILRTSWVYSTRGNSFVNKVLNWASQQPSLRIVTDQIGNPTWARMLAEITAQIIAMSGKDVYGWLRERRGLYHLAGSGYASRWEWAKAILKYDLYPENRITKDVIPALTGDFKTPASRPLFTALNCDLFYETFELRLPDWETALRMALDCEDTL
jgi:dTDP-4-dehydrorhamnose reductase